MHFVKLNKQRICSFLGCFFFFSKRNISKAQVDEYLVKLLESRFWKPVASTDISFLQAMNSGEGDYNSGGSDLKIMKLPEEDKEELQMLASLRREQEEDDCEASNLGGPVVRQWDSNTSFEESLWNPSPMVRMPSTPRLCFNVILQRIQSV